MVVRPLDHLATQPVWASQSVQLEWVIKSNQSGCVVGSAQPIWVVEHVSKLIMNSKHN